MAFAQERHYILFGSVSRDHSLWCKKSLQENPTVKVFQWHLPSSLQQHRVLSSVLTCYLLTYNSTPHKRSSSHLGMSNISAKSGGSLSLDQLARNQLRWWLWRAPIWRSSGIFITTLGKRWVSLAWFLPSWNWKMAVLTTERIMQRFDEDIPRPIYKTCPTYSLSWHCNYNSVAILICISDFKVY